MGMWFVKSVFTLYLPDVSFQLSMFSSWGAGLQQQGTVLSLSLPPPSLLHTPLPLFPTHFSSGLFPTIPSYLLNPIAHSLRLLRRPGRQDVDEFMVGLQKGRDKRGEGTQDTGHGTSPPRKAA